MIAQDKTHFIEETAESNEESLAKGIAAEAAHDQLNERVNIPGNISVGVPTPEAAMNGHMRTVSQENVQEPMTFP